MILAVLRRCDLGEYKAVGLVFELTYHSRNKVSPISEKSLPIIVEAL